jgi:hypothetical protein
MEHRLTNDMPQWTFGAILGQGQFAKADFLMAHRPHFGVQRGGHQLRAEANAQRRAVLGQALTQLRDGAAHERIGLNLIDADRATQHHQQVRRQQIEPIIIGKADIVIGHGIALIDQGLREDAKILEMDVADHGGGLGHEGSSCRGCRPSLY